MDFEKIKPGDYVYHYFGTDNNRKYNPRQKVLVKIVKLFPTDIKILLPNGSEKMAKRKSLESI